MDQDATEFRHALRAAGFEKTRQPDRGRRLHDGIIPDGDKTIASPRPRSVA
jgi:hypothetical protein